MTIEDEIKRARGKVVKARKDYDTAVEELSRLLDKHDRLDICTQVVLDAWMFGWNGEAVWNNVNGTVDYVYEATATLKPVSGERHRRYPRIGAEKTADGEGTVSFRRSLSGTGKKPEADT